MLGSDVTVTRGGREIGTLTYRSSVLDGVVLPMTSRLQGPELPVPDGVTVVATAMQLPEAARRRLSDEFGADYIVVDMFANYATGREDLKGAIAVAERQARRIYR